MLFPPLILPGRLTVPIEMRHLTAAIKLLKRKKGGLHTFECEKESGSPVEKPASLSAVLWGAQRWLCPVVCMGAAAFAAVWGCGGCCSAWQDTCAAPRRACPLWGQLSWLGHACLRHPVGLDGYFFVWTVRVMLKAQLTNGIQLKLELWGFWYANVETECSLSTWCKFFPLFQVWFQNCRARHKKHVSPNHSSTAPVTAVQPSRLSPPMLEEMAYSAYVPQDGTMLTALHSYMDGRYDNFVYPSEVIIDCSENSLPSTN